MHLGIKLEARVSHLALCFVPTRRIMDAIQQALDDGRMCAFGAKATLQYVCSRPTSPAKTRKTTDQYGISMFGTSANTAISPTLIRMLSSTKSYWRKFGYG